MNKFKLDYLYGLLCCACQKLKDNTNNLILDSPLIH